jgi:hypothetical protein
MMENQSLSTHVQFSLSHFTRFPTTHFISEYTDFAEWLEDGTNAFIRIGVPNPDPGNLTEYYIGVKNFPDVTSSYYTPLEGNR